jgi:hypothetical protein
MTLSSLPETPRLSAPHSQRLRRWGGWLGFALLAGHLIFCHGCHGDEDNELSVFPPSVHENSSSKTQNSNKSQTQMPKFKTSCRPVLNVDFGFLNLFEFCVLELEISAQRVSAVLPSAKPWRTA